MHGQRIVDDRRLPRGAGRNFVAGTVCATEEQIGIQIAVLAQELDHAVAIVGVELLVESALADALGQQLAHMAARVVHHAALGDSYAAVQLVVLHQRAARGIDLDLERNAQFVAVAKHGVVRGGQARGPGVEVVALLEGAGLARAVGEIHIGAVADAPIAAAGALARFENRARPPRLAQLVGRDQAGNSPAENHHARAFAVYETQRTGFGGRFRDGQQPKRLHQDEGSAVSAHMAGSHQELASGEAHLVCLSGDRGFEMGSRIAIYTATAQAC